MSRLHSLQEMCCVYFQRWLVLILSNGYFVNLSFLFIYLFSYFFSGFYNVPTLIIDRLKRNLLVQFGLIQKIYRRLDHRFQNFRMTGAWS